MRLPSGWAIARLEDISRKIGSGATPKGGKAGYSERGTPLIRSMNIHFGGLRKEGLVHLDNDQARALDNVTVLKDDILLNITGASIGRVCLAPIDMSGARVNQHVSIIRLVEDLLPAYVERFLAAPYMQRHILEENYGFTRQALTKSMIEDFSIPMPPIAEQHRIIAKLDALTARIARAKAELHRIQTLAEDLRRRSTFSAMNGSLTADWRASNPLSRVISDDELDATYLGVAGSQRRKPFAQIEWRPNLPLPASWRWVSVDRIAALVQYGSSSKTSDDASGVPVLRMGNIQRGQIDWTELKYLPSDHDEFPNLMLEDGDLIFNRTNSFELVGKTAVYRSPGRPASFASYLIRVRSSGILPELLAAYLNSPIGRSWIEKVASQQVGQANVNGSKLKALGIPLPPPDEQAEIMRRLNAIIARADRLEAEAARADKLLDRLESALLTKAFNGELVPQDPSDEAASVLLDRIRAQRASAAKPKRSRRAVAG